jgi:hypothetical protein
MSQHSISSCRRRETSVFNDQATNALRRLLRPSASQGLLFICIAMSFFSPASIHAHEIGKELHSAANAFIDSLDNQQRNELIFDFEHELRTDWQFVPMERKGLSFAEMKPNQRLLAMSLVQTPLSHRGFSQSVQIMALEQILHELENANPKRDPQKYHLFFFGKPSTDETWGWRIEGHHLSISFTIVDGKTVVATPAFFGTNPAEVREGKQQGLRVLGLEEDLGRKLVTRLTIEQKKTAIISETAPRDVINGPGREAAPLEPAGIAAADLDESQSAILRELIETYVGKLRSELAAADMKKIDDADFEKIHFAWAGPLRPGKPHYYRVQGPTFILEYDNTQNGANHAHCVWRDFKNDFGADLLKQHYETQPHPTTP